MNSTNIIFYVVVNVMNYSWSKATENKAQMPYKLINENIEKFYSFFSCAII